MPNGWKVAKLPGLPFCIDDAGAHIADAAASRLVSVHRRNPGRAGIFGREQLVCRTAAQQRVIN